MTSGVGSEVVEVVAWSPALQTVSVVLGWAYFIAWSCTFYPQPFTNWKRQSVAGLSLEYLMYNLTGFLFYSVFSISKYALQHSAAGAGLAHSVGVNDIVFAINATVMTAFTIGQCFYYGGLHTLNRTHVWLCTTFWAMAVLQLMLWAMGRLPLISALPTYQYNIIEYLGYVKAIITSVKCIPQVVLNRRRRSTAGFSIAVSWLDIAGGIMALSQQGIDAWNYGSVSYITSNVPKLLLSAESLVFDAIFLYQHYIAYAGSSSKETPLVKAAGDSGDSGDSDRAAVAHGEADPHARVQGDGPSVGVVHTDLGVEEVRKPGGQVDASGFFGFGACACAHYLRALARADPATRAQLMASCAATKAKKKQNKQGGKDTEGAGEDSKEGAAASGGSGGYGSVSSSAAAAGSDASTADCSSITVLSDERTPLVSSSSGGTAAAYNTDRR